MKSLAFFTQLKPIQAIAHRALKIRQYVFVTMFCGLLVYVFLCLLSYHPADPAWSHWAARHDGVTTGTIKNIGGAYGAYLADVLKVFFGFGAWAILLWLAHEAYCAYHRHQSVRAPLRALAYVWLWLCTCTLLYAMGGVLTENTTNLWGGRVGWLCYQALAGVLGVVGAWLFALVSLLAVLALLLDVRRFIGRNRSVQKVADEPPSWEAEPKAAPPAPTKSDDKPSMYQPHEHKGALASFLRHSGLQDDLQAQMKEQEQTGVAAQVFEAPKTSSVTNADALSPQPKEKASSKTPAISADTPHEVQGLNTVKEAGDTSKNKITETIMPDNSLSSTPIQSATAMYHSHTAEIDDNQGGAADEQSAQVFAFVEDMLTQTLPDEQAQPIEQAQIVLPQLTDEMIDWQEAEEAPWAEEVSEVLTQIEPIKAQTEESPIPKRDVHDDIFATQSFAMHTAAYRASLSPIPSLDLLDRALEGQTGYTPAQLQQLSELLEIKLKEFNITAQVMNVIQGPVVTSFEVQLAAGVKASKVTGIAQDLARSLSMASLRVVEVIAGKPYIGIEIPNKNKQTVKLIELLQSAEYQDENTQIAMAMGKDIGGQVVIADLAKAPHMLVAGTTGSGKSVLVNAMLMSMLLKYTPDELRLILIDPKMLELANYGDIPHLLTPVVTDMTEAASALSWCVGEMERRYQLMSLLKVRKLSEFNKKIIAAETSGSPIIDPLWRPNDSVSISEVPKLTCMPLIVVVAEEFADMIMQVGKQAEELITRLAQKSRAAGIHLVLATQRPSVDVITGLIKANIPARAALRVNSRVDSRTILDAGGAEDMLGHGDMLFLGPGKNEPIRVHGAYVTDEEVNRVCDAWRERGAPNYIDTVSQTPFESPESHRGNSEGDALYDEAVAFVIESGKTSISAVQRQLKVGYNRAANLVEAMEAAGLLSKPDSSGKRQIL